MEAWIFQVVMSLNFCWSGEISDHCPDVLNATLRDTLRCLDTNMVTWHQRMGQVCMFFFGWKGLLENEMLDESILLPIPWVKIHLPYPAKLTNVICTHLHQFAEDSLPTLPWWMAQYLGVIPKGRSLCFTENFPMKFAPDWGDLRADLRLKPLEAIGETWGPHLFLLSDGTNVAIASVYFGRLISKPIPTFMLESDACWWAFPIHDCLVSHSFFRF